MAGGGEEGGSWPDIPRFPEIWPLRVRLACVSVWCGFRVRLAKRGKRGRHCQKCAQSGGGAQPGQRISVYQFYDGARLGLSRMLLKRVSIFRAPFSSRVWRAWCAFRQKRASTARFTPLVRAFRALFVRFAGVELIHSTPRDIPQPYQRTGPLKKLAMSGPSIYYVSSALRFIRGEPTRAGL